jgi:hypothetical protein
LIPAEDDEEAPQRPQRSTADRPVDDEDDLSSLEKAALRPAEKRRNRDVELTAGDDSATDPVSQADYRVASRTQSRPRPNAEQATLPAPARERPSTESIDAQVERLDLDLSVMVSEEPTVWQFDRLRGQAEDLLAQAGTAVERGRIRLLLSKIGRFEEIKERYETVANIQADTDRRNRQLATQAGVPGGQWSDGRFDGVGKLAPLVSRQVGPAQYALLDEAGAVVYYVTPSPGLNLRPYVGHTVGVHGAMSYASELDGRLVTVKRVTMLDAVKR